MRDCGGIDTPTRCADNESLVELPTGPGFALGPFLCGAPSSGMLGTGARALKVARGPSHRPGLAGARCIVGRVEGRGSP